MATRNTDPSTPSDDYRAMERRRVAGRALMGGSLQLRDEASIYLPREPGETQVASESGPIDPWAQRVSRAILVPFFADAHAKLVGKVFANPITLNADVPKRLEALLQNINLRGASLSRFAEQVFADMWLDGMPFVLQDNVQREAPTVPTVESDKASRPFWIFYPSSCVYNARYKYVNGVLCWTRIQIMEELTEEDGDWGECHPKRLRILRRPRSENGQAFATTEFWRQDAKGAWLPSPVPEERPAVMAPHREIPGHFFAFGRVDPMCVSPSRVFPALEYLADLCLAYFRADNDQREMVRRVKRALLFYKGESAESFAKGQHSWISAMHMIFNTDTASDMKIIETSGAGGALGFQDLEILRQQIRLASFFPEIPQTRNITLGEKILDTSEGDSLLKKSAEMLQHGLGVMFGITARALGEPVGGTCKVPTDYALSDADAADLQAIQRARELGDLTLLTHLKALQRGIKALEDMDPVTEAAAVAAEKDAEARRLIDSLPLAGA